MYKYVTKKEAKPYRMFCNEALNELFTKLRSSASDSSSSFKFENYDLIGSAKFNLITCDKKTNIFDLDYNFYITKLPEKWKNNLQGLKSFIKTHLDNIFKKNQKYDVKDGQDSTSVLTYQIFNKKTKKQIFTMDLAIFIQADQVSQNDSGFLLLKHDKNSNQYILNERKDKQRQQQMQNIIEKSKMNDKLKKYYLELKNTENQKSSRELYKKALNEIYLLTPIGQREARLNNRNNRADQLNPNNTATKIF